jgi:K+-transporting ATPase ATPase A chain
MSQGVIQNFKPYETVPLTQPTTADEPVTGEDGKPVVDAEGKPVTEQVLPMGPAASQVAIKQLGTNGGGFFNVNSAHPFENPTPLANFLELLAILLIPAALCYTFGVMVGDRRQGWALLAVMLVIWVPLTVGCIAAEQAGVPQHTELGLDPSAGNMEGKETRFGIVQSTLFATVTTDASCGAVNSMHDSYTPLGGLVPLFNIQTGEVIFGGVGAGLYGILLYAILAVFIAGLMVGRTPEYIGKKIEQKEVKMAMLALIATAASILVFTAVSSVIPFDKGGYWNPPGPAIANFNNPSAHGFSELLYVYTSATGNNGSAFAGISANTPWYNVTIGLATIIGRFLFLLPLVAVAGSLAAKKRVPVTSGTLPTDGGLFVGLLVGTVVIVGALTFFPALSLGPIVEHFLMQQGKLFSTLLPIVQGTPWL